MKVLTISLTKKVFVGIIITSLLTIVGCVASKPLSRTDRSAIKAVSILEEVMMPERMYYQGLRENILGVTLGVFGALMAESGRKDAEGIIEFALEKADIDIAKIVRREFEQELKNSNLFQSIVPNDGTSAVFQLNIKIYGFAQPHGLSKQLKPMLGIEGILTKSDGKSLWKKYEYITNLNSKTPSYTYGEYLENPELMRDAFNTASTIIIGKLIEDLKRN